MARDMKYLLFEPKTPVESPLPLIVFLHGSGERGNDVQKVKIHGPMKQAEQETDFPFMILSPLCPKGTWWVIGEVVELIDDIIVRYPVDEDRIYLTGISMGGYGTWDLAAKHPEKFAAIVPICGGGDPNTAGSLSPLPIWVFHGAEDPTVPVRNSDVMVEALKKAGNDVQYTVYLKVAHDSWTQTYENPRLYEWLLKHRRHTDPGPFHHFPNV